ncbi:MAG: ABC transporter substrate-binding protein [Betaproteobacteria bacterium]|nr:ABC transporter substrate-binding protein [Betaproteobacteria bacterium]
MGYYLPVEVPATGTRRLRLILFRAAYNLPVTLGLARGVFARHGLELDIAYTRGSLMVSEALLDGERDLGVLSADDVVYEVERRGADLFMFMGLHAGILTLMSRPGVENAAELAGGRLGVDDPASGFALVAHKILKSMGLPKDRYETVASGGHELRAQALREGRIDVALVTPPFSVALSDLGFKTLARARDYLPRYQASCGVTTRRRAREHGDALVAYVRAYRESLKWALSPANRAAAVAHLAQEFGLGRDLAEPTFDALADPDDGLFPDAAIDVPGIQTALQLRVDAGLLKAPPPDPSRYYDPGYHRRALA